MDIKKQLDEEAEESYRTFASSLIPYTRFPIIGVRIPRLRKLAKKIYKEYSEEYLKEEITCFEEVLLHAFVIGMNNDINTIVDNINAFLPMIDNWSTCDSFCSSLKIIHQNADYFWKYVEEWIVDNSMFTKRFGYVLMLNYYVNDAYYKKCIDCVVKNPSDEYCVYMAQAWLLSMIYVTYPNDVIEVLPLMNIHTRKKTILKIQDSRQISKEDKMRAKCYNK